MTDNLRPPSSRTLYAEATSRQAGKGLVLQVCEDCSSVQYPPRELCRTCLSDVLTWQRVEGRGKLLAAVELMNSFDPWFSHRLPWPIVSVAVLEGVTLLCHAHTSLVQAKLHNPASDTDVDPETESDKHTEVVVQLVTDAADCGVLVALPVDVPQTFSKLTEALAWGMGIDD